MAGETAMVRIPQIVDIEVAIRLYYEKDRLYNKDIKTLFGNLSSSKIVILKNIVKEKMLEREIIIYDAMSVNTDIAYEVWGISIENLEARLKKLRQLKLRTIETSATTSIAN